MDTTNLLDDDVFSPQTSDKPMRPAIRGPGDLTPPSSGSHHDRQAPQMLMSPPPEEVLRSTRARSNDTRFSSSPQKQRRPGGPARRQDSQHAKRKRVHVRAPDELLKYAVEAVDEPPVASTSQVTIDATPNPKPRKQSKLDVPNANEPTTPTKPAQRLSQSPTKRALLQSPHANNPNADYIPPLHDPSRVYLSNRRVNTPVPHYEPPPDRFTPPREVMYTPVPSVSKSSKRKSTPWSRTKGKEKKLTIQIKKEPPEIDLSAPIPPGSPTDDPLLLHGPPPSTARRKRPPRASAIPTYSRDTPPISSTSPIRAPFEDTTQLLDMTMTGNVDTVDDVDDTYDAPLPPVFDFNEDRASSWSEDDPDFTPTDIRGEEGDFTGKYKILEVPTKADPPSSCTKERMDRWGRPVSPFPYQTSHLIPASPAEQGSARPDGLDVELSPATLHPAVLASADRAHIALQPSTLIDDMCESDMQGPPPSSSPSVSSSPRHPPVVEVVIPVATEEDLLPPSDPPSSPHALYDEGSSDGFYLGNDTIAEYEVPLAGGDTTSSEGGDVHSDTLPGALEDSSDGSYHRSDEKSADNGLEDTRVTALVHDQGSGADDSFAVRQTACDSSGIPTDVQAIPVSLEEPVDGEVVPARPVVSEDDQEVEEDAESVVRELSHEPDVRDDDDESKETTFFRTRTPLGNKLQVFSSPHNPFDTRSLLPISSDGHRRQDNRLSMSYGPLRQLPELSSIDTKNAEVIETEELIEGSGLEDFDPSVIKITSEDPMAAARAAAILRLHKYDCLEKPSTSKRPQLLLETVLKTSRRKSVAQSGISKSTPVSSHRRSTLGGMIGDKVIRPGSPAVTLSELLREAEESLIVEEEGPVLTLSFASPALSRVSSPMFKTPSHLGASSIMKTSFPSQQVASVSGPRDWTKLDWKVLDGCYTDERISLAEKRGLWAGALAPAEEINPESVVDRYVKLMNGENVIDKLGSAFTRENLLKRVRALRRKQNSGNIAPPTHSPSASHHWTPSQNYSVLMSPNVSLCEDLLPLPRLTSRYGVSTTTPAKHVRNSELGAEVLAAPSSTKVSDGFVGLPDPRRVQPLLPGPSSFSLAGKVKGLIFSYLPKTSKPPPVPLAVPKLDKGLGLPPPPPELFRKPRQPITTPAPKPAIKPPHPRDLVQLQHVSQQRPSMLPRLVQKPQQWTEPNSAHFQLPSISTSTDLIRHRRDSGASVKDLVKSFESMEQLQTMKRESEEAMELKRKKNIHDWNNARAVKDKPVWRP
ncbi:hypothetical protein BC835DRAFT_1389765 [Cytidiella melzeri]|nr:hypothetical protein BC835DRAFT_1389765 [Cytidiella melzeri]